MFMAAPSLRGDLFKHAVRGCDETLRISGSLVGRDTGTGRRHDEDQPHAAQTGSRPSSGSCSSAWQAPCQAANTRDIGLGTGRPFRARKSIIGRSTVRTAGR